MTYQMRPYQVWITFDKDWPLKERCLYHSHDPVAAKNYARSKIVYGGNVKTIELRDLTGVLETFYRRSWDD